MDLDQLFQLLASNVRKSLAQMPPRDDGTLLITPCELGMVLFSSTFQLAVQLGVDRDQLSYAFAQCLEARLPPATPRIIT